MGLFAFAVGVHQTLSSLIGAVLLAIFGLGLIASGVFVPDPIRGYPPGAPTGTPAELTWHPQIHTAAGPVAFLAIFGASLALAGRLQGPRQLYTVFTAVAGLALTVSTAAAWQRDAAKTGLNTTRSHPRVLELDRAPEHPPPLRFAPTGSRRSYVTEIRTVHGTRSGSDHPHPALRLSLGKKRPVRAA